MAKKTKQRRKPPASRRATPAREAPTGAAAQTSAAAPPAGAAPARRGVERLDPAATKRAQASRAAKADPGFAPLEAEDPAIPFDRVPYVRADLRRVAVMASVMVVLIVVANLILSKVAGS